ncbi:GAMMA TUBULIN COMPLEX PROTEIN [Salix purpurea]|uniref:Gamma-tubulin complex component n=1 Tax=Salix purpurea TaxID=77065 RepID=A0A9Q0VXV3_SALPP|nr:GAMMA TUBULIN COMPLEX PROTEIN [Salix purpurea]
MFAKQTQREETFRNLGEGIHYATPIIPLTRKTSEVDLVRGVVQMMQGLSSSLFYWDQSVQCFCVANVGIYVTHLSHPTLHNLLSRFTYAATCLQLVHLRLSLPHSYDALPTLRAFASVASHCLLRMRDVALKEEMKMCHSNKQDFGNEFTPTLLGLSSSLSSLCSAAEYLFQIVHGAIPQVCFDPNSSVAPAEIAVHILDYLYTKLDQVCLVQGGEVEEYLMLLNMFVGSIVPYIEGLDSWLFEGTLDDPFEETFAGLTLSEIFCVSVAGLIGHGDHIFRYFLQNEQSKSTSATPLVSAIIRKEENKDCGGLHKVLIHTLLQRKGTFIPENPAITACQSLLDKNRDSWKMLNLSKKFHLPPLNDEVLRQAIFGGENGPISAVKGTDYAFGFQFDASDYDDSQSDTKLLEVLFPFPTVLPSFQDEKQMSELLPFQKNSTLISRVLSWFQSVEPRTSPLPVAIIQECLTFYIKKQVDYIGGLILSKLMNEWRLMDELAVLRAIYLLGSGDLLQHFLTVIFGKLDKGETWDDDFELNTILQESIRNSADGTLLSAPDSLVVSITKNHGFDSDELPNTPTLSSTPRKSRLHNFGIDGLDSLKFTYKVSWPLELIANTESIKKYNQVMGFLLKVKRAKFALDKARRWMWKGRGNAATNSHKHHWLVEQKLLHFVDAFHQYVMDRVYHSAWRELCEGMTAAGSLDEVIEVHEAYLLSIQRQCFVVPDKLWALIASRINSILGLALDFYSIQQSLSSSGAASAMKARCEMEVERIEKQFDDCIAFLLRVLSLKLNVGNFPHLADLVTRINYNYFYMSDNGNLMTATGSEIVTSRLGKTFGASKDR